MVAIIVPTMNRSGFIRRLLYYYSSCSIENTIYIADSSDDEIHIKEIKSAINNVSSKLKVVYGHFLNTNIEEAKRLILDQVIEKYASYCGDDDFLVPTTLKKCAFFLDNNPDYSNCHGTGVVFKMKDNPLYGKIQVASYYKLLSNESDDPHIRVYDYLSNYWPIWSVRRVDEFKKTLKLLQNIPSEGFREITMGCVPIIQGKTKLLDELYVLRQVHDSRFQNPSPIEAFLLDGWHISYKEMYRIITNELELVSSTNQSKLDAYVQKGYINYYSKSLKYVICNKENNSIKNVKMFIRNYLPFIEYIYKKYLVRGLTLPKLNNRKSKYYVEFNEVYEFLKKYNN
jgi:glycosyltransferase domain-containing protein